ncbi:hypothetical protein UlMin_044049 [Ulmus minor]
MMREYVCSNTGAPPHQLVSCLESDKEALLDFKTGLEDPKGLLSFWKGSNCCQWEGISCDNRTGAVIEIDLHCYDQDSFSRLGGKIRPSITKLKSLRHLDLSQCFLPGPFPYHAFLNFTSLAVLDLSINYFNSKIPDSLVNVSSLVDVDMSGNSLYGSIPLGLADLSSLNSIGILCNLEYVDISSNKLDGTLPDFLRGAHNCLSSLQSLDLSKNQLIGKLPEWLGQLRSVETLDLSNNSLYGPIPASFGQLQSLTSLDLESNLLYGPIPASLGSLQNLSSLSLGLNRLNGTLPDSLGNLSKLSTFDVFSNQLTGLVTERHFQKLGELSHLDFSSNSFTLNVSSNWVPPFQVMHLHMGSCYVGTSFPAWLKFQKIVDSLDFSNAGLSGAVPHWFWEISSTMSYLNISFNKLEGQLPISFFDKQPNGYFLEDQLAYVDLSSNLFEGPIPCPNTTMLLDLSNNKFFGPIPSNIGNCDFLIVLDLSKNNLSGKIPLSLGRLRHLQILHLSDNNLSGEIPETFGHLFSLETLDLGKNRLTGKIPQWIGAGFESLEILNLRSNSFSGELPSSLSNLRSLRILDVTGNQLNGSIPACFGEFKAMNEVKREIKSTNDGHYIIRYCAFIKGCGFEYVNYYKDKLAVSMKGQFLTFTKALSLVVSLDLSRNSLSGEFPPEMTKLLGLVVLNLSGNHISGVIPESISNLKQLESLDFSSNRLSGPIPQSLQSLDFLQYLNLSNNDFSGKIPYKGHLTTFDAPYFAGNPRLCGPPLAVTCPGDNKDGNSSKGWTRIDHLDSFVDNWFLLSVGVGFAAGLLVPFLLMAIIKSWGDAYFGLVNKVFERVALFTYRMRRATP